MNIKKITLFCCLSFAISWVVAIPLFLLEDGGGMVATRVLLVFFMAGPALAAVLVQKLIYRESLKEYGLTLQRISVKWLLLTLAVSFAFLALSLLIIKFGNTLDSRFGNLQITNERFFGRISEIAGDNAGAIDHKSIPLPSVAMFLLLFVGGGIVGGIVNIPFMLGEELGWRGLLIEETRMLGFWKSNMLIGVIWGLWHAPVIVWGHNYPSYPYLGVLVMIVFCVSVSFMFGYVRYKTRTVIGPCILHGVINSTAGLFAFYIADAHELFGSVAGLAGMVAAVVVSALLILPDRQFLQHYASGSTPVPAPDARDASLLPQRGI